jgi:hypothetical protein
MRDCRNRRGRRRFLAVSLFLLLCVSSGWAQAEEKGESRDILAIGTGLVTDENTARAKAAAVADALNKGVEQYLARILGSRGMVVHFPRLVRGVVSSENQEVENFNILAEERVEKFYKVLVKLRINERVMAERFRENGIVLVKEQPVNLLFLVSQVEQPQNTLSYWWAAPEERPALTAAELALHRAFEEFGFFPVNRLMKSLEGKFGPEMTAPDLAREEAVRWGEVFEVPVVVEGRCELVDNKEVHFSLVALGVEKSVIIDEATHSETGKGEGIDRNLDRAARAVAARLCPAMRKTIEFKEIASTRIDILVKGLQNYRDLKRVQESLEKEIAGVLSVKQARMSGDSVGLVVDFSGAREEFLSRISGREHLPFVQEDSTSEEEAIILRMRQTP